MKTTLEILNKHSKNYGMIEDNPRAIVKASEAQAAMIEYATLILKEVIKTGFAIDYEGDKVSIQEAGILHIINELK